jgi:hypothetical protein
MPGEPERSRRPNLTGPAHQAKSGTSATTITEKVIPLLPEEKADKGLLEAGSAQDVRGVPTSYGSSTDGVAATLAALVSARRSARTPDLLNPQQIGRPYRS